MKIIVMTGSHPRHYYIAQKLIETGLVVGWLEEKREMFVPTPPPHINEQDKQNFVRHFKDRDESEHNMFPHAIEAPKAVSHIQVEQTELNSEATIKWMRSLDADLLISYGVHKLSDELLSEAPVHAWNIHGGLSPWYRGTTTLFWPFYMLKPNWAGMTVHKLSSKLDAGDILHHSVPQLAYGDGIHDVANKAVWQVGEDLQHIVTHFKLDELQFHPQRTAGKLFLTQEWQPQHLRMVYNHYNNDIVDRYLDRDFYSEQPQLIRCF